MAPVSVRSTSAPTCTRCVAASSSSAAIGGNGPVRIRVAAESALIDLDRAVPLGLIVNELVSNAARHGCGGIHGGMVEVDFHCHDALYRLSVRDHGPGLAHDDGAGLPRGLGLQLINGFVRRLRGHLTLRQNIGLEAVVEFPVLPLPPERAPPATVASGPRPC